MAEERGGFDARAIYDELSQAYEDASRDYWQNIGLRTLERLGVRPGQRLLDVPCGTGHVVMRAAELVGSSGRVVGVDIADGMVAVARDKVRAAGLGHVELRVGDMTALAPPPPSELFDAVVCSLGLFFVDDMPGLLRSFVRLVRPGGRLAVAVWGDRVFDPVRRFFVEAVAQVAPDLDVLEPWRRTEDVGVFERVWRDAGVAGVVIQSDEDRIPLRSPDDWWRLIMGSGLRRTVDALGEAAAKEVRARGEAYISEQAVTEIVNRSHCGIATLTAG